MEKLTDNELRKECRKKVKETIFTNVNNQLSDTDILVKIAIVNKYSKNGNIYIEFSTLNSSFLEKLEKLLYSYNNSIKFLDTNPNLTYNGDIIR